MTLSGILSPSVFLPVLLGAAGISVAAGTGATMVLRTSCPPRQCADAVNRNKTSRNYNCDKVEIIYCSVFVEIFF